VGECLTLILCLAGEGQENGGRKGGNKCSRLSAARGREGGNEGWEGGREEGREATKTNLLQLFVFFLQAGQALPLLVKDDLGVLQGHPPLVKLVFEAVDVLFLRRRERRREGGREGGVSHVCVQD